MHEQAKWVKNAGFSGYYTNDRGIWSPEESYPADARFVAFENPRIAVIPGVGPDAPMVVAPNGAKQSSVLYRFDLLDGAAMFELGKVLHHGAEKYGIDNWRGIPTNEHINHAMQHIMAWIAGDAQDDHLAHAFCRMMFAVATEIAKGST